MANTSAAPNPIDMTMTALSATIITGTVLASPINMTMTLLEPTVTAQTCLPDQADYVTSGWAGAAPRPIYNGLKKCQPAYDNERNLFDNMTTESINHHGVCMTFYIASYDTNYDKIFGEDGNRMFERKFGFNAFYTLPREDKLWSKFGIQGLDEFSMFIPKLQFQDASTFGNSALPGNHGINTYASYIPKTGDVVKANYDKYLYEIMEVKEEVGMYLLSKQHMWEFIVRPFKDEHISLSASTSASMEWIKDYTDKDTDIFNVSDVIDEEKPDVLYDPPTNEKSSGDPFGGW